MQKDNNNLDPDQDEGFHDHAVTILLVAWGQFIDHDITLTAETKDIRHVKGMLSFLSYHDWQIGDNNGVQLIVLHAGPERHPSAATEASEATIPTVCPSKSPKRTTSTSSTRGSA